MGFSGTRSSAWATRWALAALVSSALVLTPQSAPVVAAALTAAPSTAEPSDGSAELAEAARTGDAVVVEDWTTETSEVEALPSGQFKATISADTARVKQGDAWADVDLSLRKRADGMLEPKVAVGEVVLSGGGDAGSTLARMSVESGSYEVQAPFALPAPTLHEDTAVYADVLPDLDLVTTASATGFSFNWVVKSREAAEDPRVRKLVIPVEMDGLTARSEHGGLSFVDDSGRQQLWSPTPTMWDSSGAPSADPSTGSSAETSLSAVDDGPDVADRVTAVGATVSGGDLTLTPDAKLLDAPDVVFPVVIDPPFNRGRNGWTAVWNNFPSKSFWQTEHSLGAGYEGFEQFKVVRSYFRFDTAAIRGKKILGAAMNVRQIHQASCQARPTDVYRTGSIGTATTWNNQPARYTLQSSRSSTAGCDSGTAMVGWDIKQGATALADANAATGTFMVRARDEGDKIAWKQFDDNEANIEVTYVSYPATPTGVTLKTPNGYYPCGTVSAPTLIASTTVTLGVRVSSADGASASLRGVFARADASKPMTYPDTSGTTNVANGGTSTLTWTVANGHVIRFRAKVWSVYTYDGVTDYVESGYSPTWCYFKADITAPPPPKVTTTAFEECASAEDPDVCTAMGEAGTAGTFAVSTPATDAVSYRWSLNGSAAVTVATSGGAARTISVTPSGVMNTLSVWSADGAGNLSLKTTFVFKVNPRSPDVQWSFDSDDPGADTGREQDTPLDVGSATASDLGRVGKGLRFTSGAGAPAETTASTGVSATTAFTVGAWVRLDTPAQGTTTTLLSATDSTGNVFEFGYEPSTNSWTAGRRATSNASQVGWGSAALHVWTHLAATFDPASKTLSLYVDGRFAKSLVYPTAAWLNRTGWRIGCGRVDDTPSSCGTGMIDEVNLYSSILGADEIRNLADPTSGEEFHPITAQAASWSMNDADDSSVAVESCFGADLTTSGLPSPRFGLAADEWNRALLVPADVSQQVKLSHPVVDSTGSFTIAVDVKPSEAKPMVIVQQRGLSRDSWTLALEHEGENQGRWVFQRTTSDAAGATVVEVRSKITVDNLLIGELTTLVATYDRRNDRIALFVNGAKYSQESDPATQAVQQAAFATPWAARGELLVGSGILNGAAAPFAGQIERVDAFTGAGDPTFASAYHDATKP